MPRISLSSSVICGAAAGAVAALLSLVCDAVTRARWGPGVVDHASFTAPLLISIGVALGAALSTAAGLWRTVTSVLGDRKGELVTRAGIALALFAALTLALRAVSPTGALRGSVLVAIAPWAAGTLFGAASLGWLALERSPSRRVHTALVVASLVAGAGLFLLDGAVLVGTHRTLHAILEALVALLWIASLASLARRACLSRPQLVAPMGQLSLAVGLLCPAWLALQLAGGAPFAKVRHLLHEPSALGALVTKVATVGAPPPPLRAVEDRWLVGEQEPYAEKLAIEGLRADCADCNIVVYFVDTLRADVASDPHVMPDLTEFAGQSLSFVEAYSTASDTLQALPTLLAGRYDSQPSLTFLHHARTAKLDTAVFISTSALSYLDAQLPAFRFDVTSVVPDHSEDKPVWGYGADIPTGDAIAEHAIEWISGHRDRRFLAWVHNYDLHGWRDLRDDLLEPRVDADASSETRYRAVARTVNHSFGRLLRGLRDLGLEERTIVVFVSDHGEALGYRGFETHSAFLWQPLVRVPLVVRIPGLEPRAVDRQVSLVDVAPTLARFVSPSDDLGPYHGLDLLRLYANPKTERSLPILLRASSDGQLSMLGVVHPTRKLVLPVAGGPPQLHDLTVDDPDDTDLSALEADHASELLGDLVTSPLSIR